MSGTTAQTENPHASIPRYPLEWPLGWARKRAGQRRQATFRKSTDVRIDLGNGQSRYDKRSKTLNVEDATIRLERQLELLGAKFPVLSTNVTLNLRGIPRGDERPSDPGVACYFMFKGKATVLACDSFTTVADNIAAIAGHVEALRRIERYGVGTIEQALAGYKALPADTAADWRVALFGANVPQAPTVQDVDAAYKHRARELHPDLGGSDEAMAWLNRARDYALLELAG